MLQVRGVSCHFGGLVALDDVSLRIEEGELVGLMGPNGAGKTTLFNIISGFIHPTKGNVYFKGEKITHLSPHVITRKGLVRTFQDVRIFNHLNATQNVEVAVPGRSASSLTFGQQRLLGIARAVALKPQILLLDEPSAGLNQDETDTLSETIRRIHRKEVTIFIIEHDIGMLMSLAQRIIVLNRGRKIMEGSPEEVREEKLVIEAYFGGRKKCLV